MDAGVPAYRMCSYLPRSQRYCVAIFVIDEGARLLAQLDRMRALADRVDIVIADGGSTDGSTSRENLEPRRVRALLTKTGPGRLGTQMRMAFHYALSEGYEGIVVMDGNNKDDPSAVPAFLKALEQGYDHVQGSRFIPGGCARNTPLDRFFGVRLVHAPLIRLASGFRYTDTTNGFRAYSRRLLEDSRVAPFRDVFTSYELHYYLAIRAARLGLRVTEIPVTREYPRRGATPTKIHGLGGYWTVLRALFRACRHRFDPTPPERSDLPA